MNHMIRAAVIGLCCSMGISAYAADGDLDPSFDIGDVLVDDGTLSTGVAVDSLNRIIMTGRFYAIDGHETRGIARFNANGSLDTNFTARIEDPSSLFSTIISSLAIQTDDKILVGGQFTQVNGQAKSFLTRLNTDGSLDSSFNPNLNSNVTSIAIQSDNKILIGGNFTTVNGQVRERLARLNSDGTLDTSYNPSASSTVSTIELQTNGDALIGGSFTTVNSTGRNYIARLNSSGTLDSSFNPNPNRAVLDIEIQATATPSSNNGNDCPNGCGIIIAGAFDQVGTTARNRLARVDSTTGEVDPNYNPAPSSNVRAIKIMPSDNLGVVGDFTSIDGGTAKRRIAVLDNTGTLVDDFDAQPSGSVSALALQSGGELIASGTQIINNTSDADRRKLIIRFDTDGNIEDQPSVSSALYVATNFVDAAQRPNGKIIVAGRINNVNGVDVEGLVQFNDKGVVDTNFSGNITGSIRSILLLEDGKLLVAGSLNEVNGTEVDQDLVKLDVDGTLDTSFNAEVFGNATKVRMDSNGKLLVAGAFRTADNLALPIVEAARLEFDGSVDATFTAATMNNTAEDIVEQSDGKLLVGGFFTFVDGAVAQQGITRLLSTGARDTSFTASTNSVVRNILLPSSNKILIQGSFETVNNTNRPAIAMLNLNDGSLDTGFDLGLTRFALDTVLLQPDGKIHLGGGFSNIAASGEDNQTRLLIDGSDDPDYESGFDSSVRKMLILRSGKMLAMGRFIFVDGQERTSMAIVETGLPPIQDEMCVPIKASNGSIAVVCL